MKVTCKNTNCKHFYTLKQGEHCIVEEKCKHYTSNKRKADRQRMKCKDCEYCKKIFTKSMSEYHWECTAAGKRKVIFMIDKRICDCKL